MNRERRDLSWTIVAGYEGSTSSEDALALAADLSDIAGGRLLVACVYPYRALGGRFGSGERARAVAESGCRAAGAGRAERMAVPAGSAAEGLGHLAATEHADLVVVGSARGALPGRLLRGSTADRLLSRAVCSVAIAPSGYRRRSRRLRTIGAVLDRTRPSRTAVRTAAAIALATDGAVRVYATRGALPRDRPREALTPLLGTASLQAVAPAGAVASESEEVLDLAIASSFGRFRLSGLGRGAGGRRLRSCRCPVLVLRGKQAAVQEKPPQ
jgi:nucleotide-binding universal stress UspA family protein